MSVSSSGFFILNFSLLKHDERVGCSVPSELGTACVVCMKCSESHVTGVHSFLRKQIQDSDIFSEALTKTVSSKQLIQAAIKD